VAPPLAAAGSRGTMRRWCQLALALAVLLAAPAPVRVFGAFALQYACKRARAAQLDGARAAHARVTGGRIRTPHMLACARRLIFQRL
jgi:hypothetical protein